jgi:integrase
VANPATPGLLRKSLALNSALRAITAGVRRGSMYREFWDLEIMRRFIREGKPSESLAWLDLMCRAAALFMFFIPCRPVGMWRINPDKEVWAADDQSVSVPVKEKTDHGREGSVLVIKSVTHPNLCPVRCYRLLKAGAEQRGAKGTLWCSEAGAAYKQSSAISRLLKMLLKAAGIPDVFAAYSFRHALITWLFAQGHSEIEVNAYNGHSNNSHTALSHYYHLDNRWLGREIALSGVKPMPEAAARVVEVDNFAFQVERLRGEDLDEKGALDREDRDAAEDRAWALIHQHTREGKG